MLIAATTTEQSTKRKKKNMFIFLKLFLKAFNLFSKKLKHAPTRFARNEIFIEHHVAIYKESSYTGCPRRKGHDILGGHNIGRSKQKLYMYICPIPNGFRVKAISLYSSKIVNKKERLRTVSNTGIYCSSDSLPSMSTLYQQHISIFGVCELLEAGS
jgi:hypothetical protein